MLENIKISFLVNLTRIMNKILPTIKAAAFVLHLSKLCIHITCSMHSTEI
jgi:hypothetical protein